MAGQQSTILRQIDLAFNGGTVGGLSDSELVARFVARRGPAAEAAFAALVHRHGPMVHRVCRAIVRDHHAAQDASQATFLVLARKAGSLRVEKSLGPWLHGVACRVSAKARAAAARRQAHEARVAGMTPTLISDERRDDVAPLIHEEIARLPDRYRAPIILCDLEGHTYEEAARLLGRPVGTIKSRLARGREHLRGRLIRRGVSPTVVASPTFLSIESVRSTGWAASIDAMSRIAVQLASGRAAADLVPITVLVLMEASSKMMSLSRLKLAVATLVVGCGAFSLPVISGQPSPGEHGRSTGPDRSNLAFLHAETTASEPELDELIRTAERQLREGERAAVGRTLGRLNSLIETRRKDLRDELRSLDALYAPRWEKLRRRVSELPRKPSGNGISVPGVDLVPDSPAPQRAEARLDRILEEWHRRSAAHTSLDVRFTLRERSPTWGEDVSRAGRIVLTSEGRMRVDLDQSTGKTNDQERIIWGEDAVHQFISKSKTHIAWPIDAEDRGRLPAFLALPFCWNLSVEGMKSLFHVKLAADKSPETCVLVFIPLTKTGQETISKAIVELDLSTCLPKRYVLYLPDGKSTKEYSVTEVQYDPSHPEEFWRIPEALGWEVTRPPAILRWLSGHIKTDLVPRDGF